MAKRKRYHTIVTHEGAHIEEIEAIRLLRKFGAAQFPGVEKAKLVFWKNGAATPDGRTPEEYEADGYILVGVGGGPLDEHPTARTPRKEGVCSATLVAQALGIADDPRLKANLQFVLSNDLKGGSTAFDLAAIVKVMHQQYPDNPERVIGWAMMGLEAKYQEQCEFFAARDEFDQKALVEEVLVGDRPIKIVTIESANGQMNKLARSAQGARASVVIQRHPERGNISIFTNRQAGLTLTEVAREVRLEECRAKGMPTPSADDRTAFAEQEVVPGVPEWYYQKAAEFLLNGSLTAQGVHPTRLSLGGVAAIVKQFVRRIH